MLKELLKNKKFFKIIKEALKKQEILDVIIFGSLIRGKEKPRDIDLLVVYAQETKDIAEIIYKIRKELERFNKNFEVISKSYDELLNPGFLARESVLSEGFSLKKKKFISNCFGFRSFVLFKYSLKNLNKSKRMQFYYSLHGRGEESGVLKKSESYKFSDSIILSPVENSEVIKNFLERWQMEYTDFPIIIPEKIVEYKLKKFGK